ncbi:MAG: alanine racemase [Deltaproteobacteria bacterium]|nr:alanine racemase [Deltaproteobacteria bacterium]MBM4322009.1 alanine racemase [Deltaproteobacteria bacterium]
MKTSVSLGRPTVAEIDLRALAFNYQQIKKQIPTGVSILAVVKADAYGHGAGPVSLKLEKIGADYLGVAIPEEGMALRKGGVKTPILILGGMFQEDAEAILRYGLTPVVFDIDSLRRLSKAAKNKRKKARVHLKVDTGMGRLGVPFHLFSAFLKETQKFSNIEIEGLLSHFSMTDEEESYTSSQWEKFQQAVNLAKEMGVSSRYIHMANSATSTVFPEYSGNLIRPGIMLYGSYPSSTFEKRIKLKPVLTLKTRIHFLKSVPAGSRISYGGTFVTRRESLIATLPIGYADGYSTRLSNQGEVLIRGKRSPVVGKVCMDLIMADVTNVPGVSKGDEVILIGRQGREQITADEVARKIGSIPYEVLCLIGKRVPRMYVNR